MLPILIGFYLLYLAVTSDHSEAAIITTHRLIWVRGSDPAKAVVIPHGTVARASFDQDRRGFGITAVTIVDRNGQIIVFRTNLDSTRAHFIMNAAQAPAQLSRLPTVQYEP